ncbi:MAG: hypothetical protein KAJ50_02480 [Bacteroidales bacterium]|nr:hypothetical protein [Bacteroidales bacterium]
MKILSMIPFSVLIDSAEPGSRIAFFQFQHVAIINMEVSKDTYFARPSFLYINTIY